ncbi:MAG: tyrosine-type recombinase/integrase [archaeon]
MHLEDFETDAGKRVWLSRDELELFLDHVDGNERQIALGLAARSGLRTDEIVEVTPADIVTGPADFMARVWEGKGDKYRETPLPGELAIRIDATTEDAPDDDPLVDRPTRTLRRWTKAIAKECEDVTGDAGWQYLSPHDLRRSWAQALLDAGVEPALVMHWGGWENWKTFREHYLGVYSPEKQLAEREKVEWL